MSERIREQIDPDRVFLNSFLDEWFYPLAERVRKLPPSRPPRPITEVTAQRRAS
ncbi:MULTISPECIES: hypothetical protein [Sandaracinus]|uniref:hypothetical protein n=1 Tax=Sandaracinus TaxID=1055688 RepID=UPI0019D41B65|nr:MULTISPECIES: hypothetical protein [Sandaracinus]UJR87213.1 Hypothetical protein I5071_040 [Sandaracinus amylolyticus]